MQPDAIDDLYQDILLEHYKSPRNHKLIQDPDLESEGFNPFCGDRVVLTADVDASGRISDVGFVGQGCAISQASASMMTEIVKGKGLHEANQTAEAFRSMVRGETDGHDSLGDLLSLQGVSKYPIRVKCAVLAWDTLQKGLEAWSKSGA